MTGTLGQPGRDGGGGGLEEWRRGRPDPAHSPRAQGDRPSADRGAARKLAPPRRPRAGPQTGWGVALRARAGAARTAVPAPPPQSAPRFARTCRRRAVPSPRPASRAPRSRRGRAIASGRRRSRGSRGSRRAEARAPHPGLPLRQPLRRRRAARGRQAGAARAWSRPLPGSRRRARGPGPPAAGAQASCLPWAPCPGAMGPT